MSSTVHSTDHPNEHFPMPVRHFLARSEIYLQRGDILLLKGKASLYSLAIRWWTQSQFSHAALVFSIPSADEGFERTFLIEASIDGVDLTDLKHYARDLSLIYDIAIKRFERPWMTRDVQRSVRGHMLNYIKANYDYWTVLALVRRLFRRRRQAGAPGISLDQRRALWRRTPPSRFVCSGFVQYGFMSAVSRLVATGQLPREVIEDAIFKPGMMTDALPEEILSTTPEDLAQSDKLSWKYAISRGLVHRVASYDDVKEIFLQR